MKNASERNRAFALGIVAILGALALPLFGEEYGYIRENGGAGLSVVDVLQATGDQNTFLELLGRYDPEGFAILSDTELADKTVWAPTDAAFLAVSDTLSHRFRSTHSNLGNGWRAGD